MNHHMVIIWALHIHRGFLGFAFSEQSLATGQWGAHLFRLKAVPRCETMRNHHDLRRSHSCPWKAHCFWTGKVRVPQKSDAATVASEPAWSSWVRRRWSSFFWVAADVPPQRMWFESRIRWRARKHQTNQIEKHCQPWLNVFKQLNDTVCQRTTFSLCHCDPKGLRMQRRERHVHVYGWMEVHIQLECVEHMRLPNQSKWTFTYICNKVQPCKRNILFILCAGACQCKCNSQYVQYLVDEVLTEKSINTSPCKGLPWRNLPIMPVQMLMLLQHVNSIWTNHLARQRNRYAVSK